MKRITVDEVLAAYRVTGMKPCRGSALCEEDKTCALGALCLRDTGSRSTVYDWAAEHFGDKYSAQFLAGFDYEPPGYKIRSIGFRDGQAAAAAVFAEPSP